MSKISFDDFMKLSETEKCEKYKDLSDKDKFKARLSQPIGGKVIGHRLLTKEEQLKAETFERMVKDGTINSLLKGD